MAFGSWFKNIVKGAKNIIGKVLPLAKKGTELIKNIAPIAGNIIGGKAGEYINKAGDFAGNLNGKLGSINWGNSNGLPSTTQLARTSFAQDSHRVSGPLLQSPKMLGAGGAGRFNVPLLK